MKENHQPDRFEAIRNRIREFPTTPGLYFMKSGDKVLYIGKAQNLRSRVASYFQPSSDILSTRGPKIVEMLEKIDNVDYLETANDVDAILKEARLIKDIRPPYNTRLTDDKTFPYLQITSKEDFPGVYITREPKDKGVKLFGPFTSGSDLRGALVLLQKIFKFRTCTLDISENDHKRRFFRPCLLYSIKQCLAPCADLVKKKEYRKSINDLVKFLKSKRSVILRQLKKEMEQAAVDLKYERAAVLRDRIRLIEKLDERGTPEKHVQPEVFAADPSEALQQLQQKLDIAEPIRIIEGIDIANISGTHAVGSLVKFIDGRPFKSGYRRFKIKTVQGSDDYAMIAEVIKRRYKYALAGEEPWPHLILIDGGLGQLHAAQNALEDLVKAKLYSISVPEQIHICSLAKKNEEIFTPASSTPIRLPRTSPALKLLQYVRDEAHRFAQHYYHILRDKNMLK